MLSAVPAQFVNRAWSEGASGLEKACERSAGDMTGSQLKMQIARGEVLLLRFERDGVAHAWLAVKWEQMPNQLVLFVLGIYAPNGTFGESFELLKGYAATNGARCIRGACGEAVARLWEKKFGFTEAYRIMEYTL